ncbi:TerC family protein [Heliorestis acidaminivorans]|uniref:TerC family protein n=1 Tax=Heliorestis acidaminivorans TaxID=553427 RepID=A0A6I0F0V2_9FIRM|nr:TerC family protein [Heliorestis acidaminivorans]KAB2952704.1 TerC family protein [Heliorestis acidaminivorans]
MELSMFLEYGWVLLVLIIMEGLLAADNALVLALMVKHLPEKERKKALFYGLAGAFFFRFLSLFTISFMVGVWQLQAIGAIYLLFIALNHIFRKVVLKKVEAEAENSATDEEKNGSGFWMTVFKVELADIAFAVDSILAAVALAVALPKTNLPAIGGMDGGHFLVVFIGGFIGLAIMRYAATFFVKLLQRKPGLELAAFLIVGWVGVKLSVFTLSHPALAVLPEGISHMPEWKYTFYGVLVLIALGGWFLSEEKPLEVAKQESL